MKIVRLGLFAAVWASLVASQAFGQPPSQADTGQVPQLRATVGRPDSRIVVSVAGERTICRISSRFGIDRAVVERLGERWPAPLVVRLHLKGLESFTVTSGGTSVQWSASAEAGARARVSLRTPAGEQALAPGDPNYAPVCFRKADAGGDSHDGGGYFEISLPAGLFAGNPQQIELQWIDFYRG